MAPHRNRGPRGACWIGLGGFATVAALAVCLSFRWDDAVQHAMAVGVPKPAKTLAGLVSRYGDTPELMLAGLLGLVLAWRRKWERARRLLAVMLLSAAIAGGAANGVRLTLGRTRPNNHEVAPGWYGPWHQRRLTAFQNKFNAFPSGHTAGVFGFFGVLCFARGPLVGWFLVPALLIGGSRVVIGAHHLSDVLCGVAFGLVFAALTWKCIGRWVNAARLRGESPSLATTKREGLR
jgi:membrane-associated phospholipid phosphatase